MKNVAEELRGILVNLENIDRVAHFLSGAALEVVVFPDAEKNPKLSDKSIDVLVSLGCQLSSIVKNASDALEPIKQALRTEALNRNNGAPGVIQFDAPDDSCCIVTTPPPSIQVRKDVDMEKLKVFLGDAFDSLFEEVHCFKVRQEILVSVGKLKPDETKAVMEAVDLTEDPPRVSFKD